MKEAINSLKQVKEINSHIICWIVGFETDLLMKTLYRKAWESGVVQYLHVFETNRKGKNESTPIEHQMKSFLNIIEQCGESGRYSWKKDFVIHWNGELCEALNEDKAKSERTLFRIYSTDFWESLEKGEAGDRMFKRPEY
jgi:hypothetical protein